MANYLYRTELLRTNTSVGKSATNDADVTDFETNHKSTAVEVSRVELSETTFVIEDTYAAFEARLVSPVTWADVKYTEDESNYELHLLL